MISVCGTQYMNIYIATHVICCPPYTTTNSYPIPLSRNCNFDFTYSSWFLQILIHLSQKPEDGNSLLMLL